MRSRHAAVLVYLGWLLIGPPQLQNRWWQQYWPWTGSNEWRLDAPLSAWTTREEYPTREKCQDDLTVMRKENAEYLTSSIQAWQCVASDDPRLKK